MPIADLQIRMRELGRIRTGMTVATSRGKTRPEKLETFRLTSPTRELIDHAAAAYGGVVTAWEGEWEVVTTSPTLAIMVPPGQSLSQWYELWSGGGCQRRCDGRRMVLPDDRPCACPEDAEERREQASANPPTACKPTTRLNVMLPELPDLGVWRLESHGYYAAVELAGAAGILTFAAESGRPIAARLRLDRREKKTPGQPTKVYMVPVVEFVDTRIADLIGPGPDAPRQLGAGPGVRHEGPEADLPETSDFRAPVEDPNAPAEPLEEAAPQTGEPLGDSPVEPGADVPPSAPGLTQGELIGRLNAAHVTTAQAVEWAHRIFPERPDDQPLTPPQRLALWEEIEAGLTRGL